MAQTSERMSLSDMLNRLVDLGVGAAVMTREAVERTVDEMVSRGEMSREEGKRLAKEMADKGEQQRSRMEQMMSSAMERLAERMDLAKRSELQMLQARLNQLESRLARLEMEEPGMMPPSPEEGL